jgi:hypothetical protein
MIGFRLGDVGVRRRHVVLGLIERLPRGVVALRQSSRTPELRLHGALAPLLTARREKHSTKLQAKPAVPP